MWHNIRLIGVVHGILAIGLIGRHLMTAGASGSRMRHRSSKSIGGAIAMILLGLCIFVIGSIDNALNKLAQASPPIKKRVLEACVICLAIDGVANLKEAELLRAIADGLDCPVPPFLPGSNCKYNSADWMP